MQALNICWLFLQTLFRACIWWKYLDQESILPPPFTVFYFMIVGLKYLVRSIAVKCSSASSSKVNSNQMDSPIQRKLRQEQEWVETDKREFHKR